MAVERLLTAALFLLIWVVFVHSLENIAEYSPSVFRDLTFASCTSQGYGYFDTLTQTCKNCPEGFTADLDTRDVMGDPRSCKCALGYYKTTTDCYGTSDGTCEAVTCTACSSSAPAAYSDHSGCVACGGTTNGIGTDLECACADNTWMLAEANATGHYLSGGKQCYQCADGSAAVVVDSYIAGRLYEADRYSCRSCPDPLMSMSVSGTSYSCSCPGGYTLTGVSSVGEQSCVLTTMISEFTTVQESASTVTYYETDTATSLVSQTILHFFARAAAHCTYNGGDTSSRDCQALANMCALTLYDTSYGPCRAFKDATTARTGNINDVMNWATRMPWMFVNGGGGSCFLTKYRTQVSLFDQMMRYVVGKYTLNGTFAGYEEVGTLFTYCSRTLAFSGKGGGAGSSTTWQYYGASETQNYQCDLETLLEKEMYFYELFLYDPKDTTTANNLLPVPIRVVGIGGSTTINKLTPAHLCDKQDSLVRRFFLFDTVSGISSTSGSTPDVIRYAANITLEMALSEDEYRIPNTPVLTLYFGESETSTWPTASTTNDDLEISDTASSSSQVQDYTFKAVYSMDMSEFKYVLYIFGILSGVLCGLYFLFRINAWWLRSFRGTATDSVQTLGSVSFLFAAVYYGASSYTYFYFPITTLVCWYFVAFYKLQSVPAAMLPPVDDMAAYVIGNNYYAFTTTVQAMFFLHLFYCLSLIYRQCNADIVFLDWEPAVGPKAQGSKVSVWRSIFVANEWAEMQVMRKIDPAFTLFWLVFFLIGLGQENVATMQPSVTNLEAGDYPVNPWLRFGNSVFWWLAISLFQWLWKFLVYERFFDETQDTWFIDFATLAKISIFCFDEPFHGYYLHCRSPYQHADGTMAELQQMLERETQGMTTDRALDNGFPGVQAFQVYLTGDFRTAFMRIYSTMNMSNTVMNRVPAALKRGFDGGGGGAGGAGQPLNPDKQLRAWRELSVFLQEFVENNFGKVTLRRTIRDPTPFERFTGYPADLSRNFDEPNVFIPDRDHRFTSCTFLGRELELLLMNILAYVTFDMWLENTAYAATLTYLLDFFFCWIRKTYGTAVITSKTMIDDRFLK